jgi:hypothetical protein
MTNGATSASLSRFGGTEVRWSKVSYRFTTYKCVHHDPSTVSTFTIKCLPPSSICYITCGKHYLARIFSTLPRVPCGPFRTKVPRYTKSVVQNVTCTSLLFTMSFVRTDAKPRGNSIPRADWTDELRLQCRNSGHSSPLWPVTYLVGLAMIPGTRMIYVVLFMARCGFGNLRMLPGFALLVGREAGNDVLTRERITRQY